MSSNPLIDQIMGFSRPIREDVPVPCACIPTRTLRDRMNKERLPLDGDGKSETEEDLRADVRAVLGEAEEEKIIPDDAQPIDDVGRNIITTKLNPIKDVVQEPSHPYGPKEKYLTPYAALTAPDATPEGLSPIDPSRVPGQGVAQAFTWDELKKAGETPAAAPASTPIPTPAVNPLDVLLGRQPTAKSAEEFGKQGTVTTEEAALSAAGISNPIVEEEAKAKAAAALVANPDPTGASLMPDHKAADTKTVCEIARRFI